MGTGVNVSKANLYATLKPPVGVVVSKAIAYAVLRPPVGVNVTKANLYAVVRPPVGVNVSKSNLYAVLAPVTFVPGRLPMTAAMRAALMHKSDFVPVVSRKFVSVVGGGPSVTVRPVLFVIT